MPESVFTPPAAISLFIWGKRMTSRIEACPVSSMTSRSMPMPSPAGGRHAVLEGADVVLVHRWASSSPCLAFRELLLEALPLVDGIVQLGEGVRELHARRCRARSGRLRGSSSRCLGQRRYLGRVVVTKVGWTSFGSTSASKISSRSLPRGSPAFSVCAQLLARSVAAASAHSRAPSSGTPASPQ